jgi:hypothetical protein
MSTLNANVFFELGIRTSLNKPVCLVKDDLTDKVPFDTSIINYHTYSSALNPWELKEEIEKLTTHITDTLTKSSGKNALWKYFGLSATAEAPSQKGGEEDRLAFITLQLDGLRKKIEEQGQMFISSVAHLIPTPSLRGIFDEQAVNWIRERMKIFMMRLSEIVVKHKIMIVELTETMPNKVVIRLDKKIDDKIKMEMSSMAFASGINLEIVQPT